MSKKHYSQQYKNRTNAVNSSDLGKNDDTNFTYMEGVDETKTLYSGKMDPNLDMGNIIKVPKNFKSLCKQRIGETDLAIWGDAGIFGLALIITLVSHWLTDIFDFPDLNYPIGLMTLSVTLSGAYRSINLIILRFRFTQLGKSRKTFSIKQYDLEVDRLNRIIDGRLFINQLLSLLGKKPL